MSLVIIATEKYMTDEIIMDINLFYTLPLFIIELLLRASGDF